jgi:transcription elongation factor/antiterminator RfaH
LGETFPVLIVAGELPLGHKSSRPLGKFCGGSPSEMSARRLSGDPVLNLGTCAAGSAGTPFPWYALQCWLRKESLIAAQLEGQGLECFLPKYKSIREWSDRKKEVEQPLFPGYLFCRFDYTDRRPVVVTPGVLQVVGCGRKPTPIEDHEIQAIQVALASGVPGQPWPYLEVGERVRIHTGKLSGIEGILINFKGNHRVVLSVTLLQRSVALEVDLSWVASLEKRSEKKPQRVVSEAPARVFG